MATSARRLAQALAPVALRRSSAGQPLMRPLQVRALAVPPSLAEQQRSVAGVVGPPKEPYRAFLLDMDGVLHQFGKPIAGAADFLSTLLAHEVPFCVLTNECRYTKAHLQRKLEDVLGVKVPDGQIYTAACSVGDYFARAIKNGWSGNVFVIGEAGVTEAVSGALSSSPNCRMYQGTDELDDSLHCDFVCIGTVFTGGPNDSWTSVETASTFLKRGAKLVYSNPDWFEVTDDGKYKFGCPMPAVQLLEQTTGCSSYNLGKPNPFMLRQAHKHLVHAVLSPLSQRQRSFVRGHINLDDVLFVGDSLNTDVRIALENNIDVALLLSGTTKPEQLKLSALQPNYVFNDIQAMHAAWAEGRLFPGGRNNTH